MHNFIWASNNMRNFFKKTNDPMPRKPMDRTYFTVPFFLPAGLELFFIFCRIIAL